MRRVLAILSSICALNTAIAEIVLTNPIGDEPFCKVFSTGGGACDYESAKSCQDALGESSEEICLPRKVGAKGLSKINAKKPTWIDWESETLLQHLSAKQTAALKKFKDSLPLMVPLIKTTGTPNRFSRTTIYYMRNFAIIQKVDNGYLVTPNGMGSGRLQMQFGVGFLQTAKQLSKDLFISGLVIYDGELSYVGLDGFEKNVPRLKIPADLPLTGIHPDKIDQEIF